MAPCSQAQLEGNGRIERGSARSRNVLASLGLGPLRAPAQDSVQQDQRS
jgi:hypothetical protein